MKEFENLRDKTQEIQSKLKIKFKDPHLLHLALVHSSFLNENKQIKESNERLEFLGDSVLGLVVCEFLYNYLPTAEEGTLSHIKSSLVDTISCANYFKELQIEEYLLLGKGEILQQRGQDKILSDAFEALLGSICLDQGYLIAQQFIVDHFKSFFVKTIQTPDIDYKGKIQEYSQKKYQKKPEYKVLKETGPDHQKEFEVAVIIDDKQLAVGVANSKKLAEQKAAKHAIEKINE